jgi:inositol 1,4,5-triphosphate receptor type 1
MQGGGLGEAINVGVDLDNNIGVGVHGWRMLFDLSFFILITTIGLNVVFGIIVDTFSELRDEKFQVQAAMENECFICTIKCVPHHSHCKCN